MKYEFTGEEQIVNGKTVHRIRYTTAYPELDIKKGQNGGWIESSSNLSQNDHSFVLDEAVVMEHANVSGNVLVSEFAKIYGEARLLGNIKAKGTANICESAHLEGFIFVEGDVWLMGKSRMTCYPTEKELREGGELVIGHGTHIFDQASIEGVGEIYDSKIFHNATIQSDKNRLFIIKKQSVVMGDSFISSTLLSQTIFKKGKAMDSVISDSKIQTERKIEDSTVRNSTVSGKAVVEGSRISQCLIQNDANVSHSVLGNVNLREKTKVISSNINCIGKKRLIMDNHAVCEGVLMSDVVNVRIQNKSILKYVKFLEIENLRVMGTSSIVGKEVSPQERPHIIISDMKSFYMKNNSQISNLNDSTLLMANGTLNMSDYAQIEGVFQLSGDISLTDCSSLRNDGSSVHLTDSLSLTQDDNISYA